MKIIYKNRRKCESSSEWITYSEFDPMNIMKEKQAVKAPDLFKGRCIYARLNQDAENPYALQEIFTNGLKQPQDKRIIVTSKQAATIHFKSPDEAKAALEAVQGVKIDGGFRLSIL